jgi:hypothetical protein
MFTSFTSKNGYVSNRARIRATQPPSHARAVWGARQAADIGSNA